MRIYPSLISSDLLNIKKTLSTLDSHCDGYHLDVMDDSFVPNLTWGADFINAISQATQLPVHVHLMVHNPEKWISRLLIKKNDFFIFHYEAIEYELLNDLIQKINIHGWNIGIALNPSTPVEKIFDIFAKIDMVLLMSVQPGFSGQKFIPETVKKIAPLIEMKKKKNSHFSIGMDGGINTETFFLLNNQNIDSVAIASAIFNEPDAIIALKNLYISASPGINS